jgi:hypothetical protein
MPLVISWSLAVAASAWRSRVVTRSSAARTSLAVAGWSASKRTRLSLRTAMTWPIDAPSRTAFTVTSSRPKNRIQPIVCGPWSSSF